jgi:hypothetical protein
VLTNWRRCQGMQALVTTTSVSFYFNWFIFSNSHGDSTIYRTTPQGTYTRRSFGFDSLTRSSSKLEANPKSFLGTRLFFHQELLVKLVGILSSLVSFFDEHYGEYNFDTFIFGFIFISS